MVSDKDSEIIDSILQEYDSYSAYQLVEMTHAEGQPWALVYRGGLGLRNPIPFELLSKEALNV